MKGKFTVECNGEVLHGVNSVSIDGVNAYVTIKQSGFWARLWQKILNLRRFDGIQN